MVLSKKDKILCLVFFVILTTAIAYYPSLNNSFINWDDDVYVSTNPNIRSISWENTKEIFTTPYFGNYAPLTLLTYAVEYRLAKLNPRAYHATNLILHLFNCMLVFWLIYLLSGKEYVALIVSLLFGVHPLHVEPVAWVSQRKDVLYSFFFLFSLISYIKYLKERGTVLYIVSLLLFILSCLSKAMAITLPLILCFIDYFFHYKVNRRSICEKIPYFIITFAFGAIAVLTQYDYAYKIPEHAFSFFHNICAASYGLLFYIYKILLPIQLSALYPRPQNIAGELPLSYIASCFVLIILTLLIVLRWRNNRKLVFGVSFFLISILPVLQFMPIGWAIAADRYTYIPALGIFYVFGEACSWLSTHELLNKRSLKIAFFSLFSLVLLAMSVLTWQRCHIWKDSITFWNDVISKYPTATLAYNNRGNAYAMNGDDKRAIEDYKTALRLEPRHLPVLSNLFRTYCKLGMTNTAIFLYNATIRQHPEIEKGLMDLGKSYLDNNLANNAISLYITLLIILPQDTQTRLNGEIYNNLALAYSLKKEFEAAKYYAKKAKNSGYKVSTRLEPYLESGR